MTTEGSCVDFTSCVVRMMAGPRRSRRIGERGATNYQNTEEIDVSLVWVWVSWWVRILFGVATGRR